MAGCQKELQAPEVRISYAPNQPPVARAGNDITILLPQNSTHLVGSNSYDPDNNIKSYDWARISGPASFNILHSDSANTSVSSLALGLYEFVLAVTDSSGEISRDTCKVIVGTADFDVPISPADTFIYLPENTVMLKASVWGITDPPVQLTPIDVKWSKIYGPDSYLVSKPNDLRTTVTNLKDGLYAFECRVTDSFGQVRNNVSVINVADTSIPTQEVIISNPAWQDNMGGWPFAQIVLRNYIPVNKSVKKVFLKHQYCDSNFVQATYFTHPPSNTSYNFSFGFFNNELYLVLAVIDLRFGCTYDSSYKTEIKIVY